MIFNQQYNINCNGRILSMEKPLIMAILNLTPDSFYDGGRWTDKNILKRVAEMLAEGADIVDIGAMSSKPGADFISVEQEMERLISPLKAIVKEFPEIIISVDTWRSEIVKAVHLEGAHIINDISAGNLDDNLFKTVATCGMPYVLMHMQGTPQNMQQNPFYTDINKEILDFFIQKLEKLRTAGIKDIVLDPGFGFGKTLDNNYELLACMHNFKMLELPILAGVSRKSMICRLLKCNPENALNGSTALHMLCLERGAKILRVHDVKETAEAIKIWNLYNSKHSNTTYLQNNTSLHQ
jgi:dihydropteroate synthase